MFCLWLLVQCTIIYAEEAGAESELWAQWALPNVAATTNGKTSVASAYTCTTMYQSSLCRCSVT